VLQFVYIPAWAVIASVLLAIVVAIDIFSDGNLGLPTGLFAFVKTGISWRRLRMEWSGRPEVWMPFTDARLAEIIPGAEKSSGWDVATLPPSGVRRATCELPVRHYRGLDSTALDHVAQRHGWSLDRKATRKPDETAHFVRLIPPPPHTGVPDPYGPAPRAGAPWGPLPRRFLTPLLTFVFMPRLRTLEWRGNANAYVDHLRAYLPGQIDAEMKKKSDISSFHPRYTPDESGNILRRIDVSSWHYRGAGAHAVLFVAAELGWRIDHTYPARPDGTVHLCRLDTTSSPTPRPAAGR
jgi:hypothetical protein